MKIFKRTMVIAVIGIALTALAAVPAAAQQVINNSLVVKGSQCLGFDCPNSPSFGFDTLQMRENNLRIDFTDTSNTGSFPTSDWTIVANDSTNGGRNAFFITMDGGPGDTGEKFTIQSDAQDNAIYARSNRVGLGTSNPVVELHIVDGDSPTLRLEQDGSSGFAPQTWDLAGNETNFFVRDVTNGSKLPFRIQPSAPTNSIYISNQGRIGVGTASPTREIHIVGNNGPRIQYTDTEPNPDSEWVFGLTGNQNFFINDLVRAGTEFQIGVGTGLVTIDGDLTINGNCSDAPGGGGCTPDYVFEPDYALPTLDELSAFVSENKHLPNVPNAEEIAANGINMRRFNFALLEKIEELVLYTLAQQETIDELAAEKAGLKERLTRIEARLALD